MFFGHVAPLAREVRTSAHNWYLDIAYTFGLISLLPIFVLIGYTIYLFWRRRTRLPLDTRWLAFIVCYLVVIDNNFKVSLRQPYPGIFTYFLWGLLLSRLTDSDSLRSCRIVFKK
jgi:O-antigen ligase